MESSTPPLPRHAQCDLELEEEEAPDLLMAIEEELRKRRFGRVVRLEIERTMLWRRGSC